MDQLIPVINKLQDVFNTIGSESIQLPQIAVVGSQSSGKSSVLENIVGKDFLPRGHGIVTRRPLVLQLVYTPESSSRDVTEWGEFLHLPQKKFSDFQEIRKEIEAETDRVTGSNKGISAKPINLKVYSPHVLNLTLVDLPGITKVPVGDQPDDIEKQIRSLVRSYISNPSCIILAVTPANVDLANSDALKLAKSIDPEGNRTIGVVTKIDLMDPGTDALDILNGRIFPIKHGFIGVVNRSQADINSAKPISESLKSEESFFGNHPVYHSIAQRCGTPYLAKSLNRLLMHHIRDCLPDLKNRISTLTQQAQQTYNAYGEALSDKFNKGSLLLQIITKFSNCYSGAIEGTSKDIQTDELCGGARICYIFHETFGKTLESVDPLEGLTINDIRTAIRNATGPRPALFIPEVSFELLVKRQIRRLEEPSLRCVELVFEELLRIIQQCEKQVQELLRFQGLREHITESVTALLRNRLPAANTMIENLVSIELAYINTNHPDFVSGTQAVSNLIEKSESQQRMGRHHANGGQNMGAINDGSGSHRKHGSFSLANDDRAAFNELENFSTGSNSSKNSANNRNSVVIMPGAQPVSIIGASGTNTGAATTHSQLPQQQQQPGGLFGLFGFTSRSKTSAANGVSGNTSDDDSIVNSRSVPSSSELVTQPHTLGTSSSTSTAHSYHQSTHSVNGDMMFDHLPHHLRDERKSLSPKEQMETEMIQHLISNYFKIVRKNIQDTVPKAVMHFLVNWIKENIQSELVSQLYREDYFDKLLEESQIVAEKRKSASELLQALKRANKILGDIRSEATL